MFFRMRLTVNQELLARWRAAPERIQQNFRRKLVTILGPELQKQVDDLMVAGPGPSLFGVQFNTDKSRRYWFLLIRANPWMTSGGGKAHEKGHYLRTGLVEAGFRVFVSDRLRGNQFTVRNIQEAAKSNPRDLVPRLRASYVYGPRYVLGHIATGWVDEADAAQQLLQVYVIERCKALFSESVKEGLRG